MTTSALRQFQATVWNYYHDHARDLPWRHEPFDAYRILVSEMMLQQTQAQRVIPKYQAFLERFPTIQVLARASLADVLTTWSGLGYNRRAKYLHEAARHLIELKEPWTLEDLVISKGIGRNTAAAVLTYAYNQPVVFIETNVRTVFIHHFLADEWGITDKQLLPLVEAAIDRKHPREWYWALMDYGSYLKTSVGNAARASRHYAKQSTFAGSIRQLRGQVLRNLAADRQSKAQLKQILPDERLDIVLDALVAEGLVAKAAQYYLLPR